MEAARSIVRMGRPGDVESLADLFDMANHGDIAAIWGREARPGESWKQICARHMNDPGSEIHFGKTLVALVDGEIAGMLMFFHLRPSPVEDIASLPEHARAFAALRSSLPECVYLRDMAVFPQFRGRRLASGMLDVAIRIGFNAGLRHAAAIVHESNTKLLEHYYKRGLRQVGRHAVLAHTQHAPESHWLLLQLDAPGAESGATPTKEEA